MREQLVSMQSSTESGKSGMGSSVEESKSPSPFSTSIAGVRHRFADGGSGSINFAPIVVETSVPPSYVTVRVKAHEIGGCIAFRP